MKDNGTCTFSGAVTGTHTCTVAGAFTISAGPDGGVTGETLYGTIVFPSAPAPGTYTAPSSGSTFVPASTTIELSNYTTGNSWWATTALGSFTLVLSTVNKLGSDPEIGDVYRPYGSLDATLVPISAPTTGNVTLHATF